MGLPKELKNLIIMLTLMGLLTIVLPIFLPIEITDGLILTPQESWQQGIGIISLFFGTILLFLNIKLAKGKSWVKYPIMLWLPVLFIVWEILTPTKLSYFEWMIHGLPLTLLWLWVNYSVFKTKEVNDYLNLDSSSK